MTEDPAACFCGGRNLVCVCGGESGMVDLLRSSFGWTWKEKIVSFMQLQSLPSKDVIPEEPRALAA